MTAETLRAKVFQDLNDLGFRPANSLPLPDMDIPLRPPEEVAGRLMSLDALFTWVVFPKENVPDSKIEGYIERNDLRSWLTDEEQKILDLPRAKARKSQIDKIGWKLENMWALAWVLGFEPAPSVEAYQVGEELSRPLIYEFLPGLGGTIEALLEKTTPRDQPEVVGMEYRFYCAHNAVRSAQLGHPTVPEGFHPILHGGGVHERRHALTWSLAPDVSWEDTDLST